MAKGKKHAEDEILEVFKEIKGGATIASIARAHGVIDQTLYRWREMYGGMQSRELQAENQRLKRIVAVNKSCSQMAHSLPKV
ncbi:MAG: transposase [Fimbriimonas sp.]